MELVLELNCCVNPGNLKLSKMMATLLLKRLTLHTVKTGNNCIRCPGTYTLHQTAPARPSFRASGPRLSCPIHAKAFGTVADTQDERKKKKKNEPALSNIGRKIHERVIHVLDEAGNDLGNMHRADVIRLMNERDLRLVTRDSGAEPPQYQLLTGAQIHEERLRLRELGKAHPKPGPTLTKELTFSSNIGRHDLDTKSKQIQQWIEKKYRVQITIKKGKNVEPENKMEEICNQILHTMPGIATFSTRPQPVRGGKAVMCVLRHLSKKEENAHGETQGAQKEDPLNKENGNNRESDVVHP
ncbi:translation initiation factor IF-3, mitochondrial isoform X1 [Acinonyx jubatus]|uniref:Translation initiation factor IF-3, mitochondrial n=2 Tax=Acinonyx jubatus TaxID=32536 RepID=A0A6J0A6J5_ACIJB|nr:translation initiation factor IF-3, mitochondrial isoform X1 [Acinonyx jubatus]XP_014939219.1 translation initiation factor IF-3, mitochondrial isoform X1 [Acinonyx jubatus]